MASKDPQEPIVSDQLSSPDSTPKPKCRALVPAASFADVLDDLGKSDGLYI